MKSENVRTIAIIGSGPRGLSVLERLCARLMKAPLRAQAIEIHLIDSHAVGTGRIWRTNQSQWLTMNTVADEVSAFSGPADDGPPRPGAGPSLAQWWSQTRDDYPGPNSYASRAVYGLYMQFVLSTIEEHIAGLATLKKVNKTVIDIARIANRFEIAFADGMGLCADKVVLVTGHSKPAPSGPEQAFAAKTPGLSYMAGDSVADLPLDAIEAGSSVGVIGLGLSFYDVMASLTLERGGRFTEGADGRLVYHRSGREPIIHASSRSGMPLPARGWNQKDANFRYSPLIFTADYVKQERQRGPIDFRLQILPRLLAEVNLVYFQSLIKAFKGAPDAVEFRSTVAASGCSGVADIQQLAQQFGIVGAQPIDLDRLAHPFEGQLFANASEFRATLLRQIDIDLAEAELGNVDSPVKAALDVIRDTRSIVRSAVDYGGLTPESHRGVFLDWYVPRSSFLAAGPPRIRLKQTRALIECGVLNIIGPSLTITCSSASRCFQLSSPAVANSTIQATTLVDARIPVTDIRVDQSPLMKSLQRRGMLTSFVNDSGEPPFDTGGVRVTGTPFYPIGREDTVLRDMYVLGIPTEHTRWFMQAGSSRPGFWTDFVWDADAIACDCLHLSEVSHQDSELVADATQAN